MKNQYKQIIRWRSDIHYFNSENLKLFGFEKLNKKNLAILIWKLDQSQNWVALLVCV